eukprot:CAMPEP_0179437572 /NCGR_PEP_ID=MMETSP0799-20121207/21446_1 /TAXON_ID=46947 /ORGANISM="Geminigera cryophila, Strain CCMP2564" /LENGTH=64 /DNA_ID=CAMNT_0021218605 /DNA_START=33 /DNA_END=227 /DNA_ORIENTATION=+
MFKIEGCGAGDDKQGRTMFKTVGCGRGDDKQGDGVLNHSQLKAADGVILRSGSSCMIALKKSRI